MKHRTPYVYAGERDCGAAGSLEHFWLRQIGRVGRTSNDVTDRRRVREDVQYELLRVLLFHDSERVLGNHLKRKSFLE